LHLKATSTRGMPKLPARQPALHNICRTQSSNF